MSQGIIDREKNPRLIANIFIDFKSYFVVFCMFPGQWEN